ncbi:MAG: OmpA family protein [Oscillospiraceae bacterium]|jgi:chemotaxis protein MotB|nr:OmpA family protein [Oscillospiraceae bacterium]
MHKKKKHEEHENGEAWLLPYSDLMTLLLAMFIVLFAVSKVDLGKASAVAGAFQNMMVGGAGSSIGIGGAAPVDNTNFDFTSPLTPPSPATSSPNQPLPSTGIESAEYDELREFEVIFHDFLEEAGLTDVVTTVIDERGLVIRLSTAILFDSSSAVILPQYHAILINIGRILNEMPNYIRIEGHTDDRPISTARYPSNIELSCARAASVAHLFLENVGLSPEKIAVLGYADTRPIATNQTSEGRAMNRRVDIVLMLSKFDSLEEQHGYTELPGSDEATSDE